MTALTNDRATPYRAGHLVSDPLAATAIIYAGAMYALDASGNAVAATEAGTNVRAVAQARAVQANGDTRVEGQRGVWRFNNSTAAAALTRADIGGVAFVADDQTVSKTGTAIAGLVFDIDDNGDVWVDIGAASVTVAAAEASGT